MLVQSVLLGKAREIYTQLTVEQASCLIVGVLHRK